MADDEKADYDRNDAGEVLPPGPENNNTGDLDGARAVDTGTTTSTDGGTALKGYIPPSGPQNLHGARYQYMAGQGAHRIGSATIYSPEGVILTADRTAQREIERHGLHEIDDEGIVDDALEAIRDDDPERANDVVAEYRKESEDVATVEEDRQGIPDDADLDDAEYRDLQDLAKDHGIAANQSADELRTQLAAERDGTSSYDESPEDELLDSEGGTRGDADAETMDSEGGTRAEADDETLDSEGDGGELEPEANEPAETVDESETTVRNEPSGDGNADDESEESEGQEDE